MVGGIPGGTVVVVPAWAAAGANEGLACTPAVAAAEACSAGTCWAKATGRHQHH